MYVLVSDETRSHSTIEVNDSSIEIIYWNEINTEMAAKIADKYRVAYLDGYRWSMKSVLLSYLTNVKQINKVVYVDPDIYFYQSPAFLFEELEDSDVLLTPHWRGKIPEVNPVNFALQFQEGIYNAGFIAVNAKAQLALEWWANACLYKCEPDKEAGILDDQSYLNLLPVYFDNVKILKHQGCNVANWNRDVCKRELNDDGETIINDKYPIIFIHYTGSTIGGILKGKDDLLANHLNEYKEIIDRYVGLDNIVSKKERHIKENKARKIEEKANSKKIHNRLINKIKSKIT